MINPQWLELFMSRTNLQNPKDVRVIEIQLYVVFLMSTHNICGISNEYLQYLWINKKYIHLETPFILCCVQTYAKKFYKLNIYQDAFLLGMAHILGKFTGMYVCTYIRTYVCPKMVSV